MGLDQERTLGQKIASLTEEVDEQAREQLIKALRTSRDAGNPDDAVLAAFKVLEGPDGILSRVASSRGKKLYTKSPYKNQLNWLKNAVGIPEDIFHDLEVLRRIRNEAAHAKKRGRRITSDDFVTAADLLLRVLEWFYCAWQQPGLETIYSAEPIREPTLYDLFLSKEKSQFADKQIPPKSVVGLRPLELSDAFRDRECELFMIQEYLQSPLVKCVFVVGRAGMGKTALVNKVYSDISDGRLDLGKAAHETGMGAGGIIYVDCISDSSEETGEKQGFSLEQLLIDAGRMLGSPYFETLESYAGNSSLSDAEKVEILLTSLKGGPYLLILDNMESSLSAARGTFKNKQLQVLIEKCLTREHPLRIIATTREYPVFSQSFGRTAVKVEVEKGLPPHEAANMLRDLDRDGSRGLRDAPEEKLLVVAKKCLYMPIALEAVSGLLEGAEITLDTLIEDEDLFEREVVEKRLIARQFERLTEEQRYAIQGLAVFGEPVPAESLGFLFSDVCPMDYSLCLGNLYNAHLVMRRTDNPVKYELHRLYREHAYNLLLIDKTPSGRIALHRKAADYWTAEANEQAGSSPVSAIDEWGKDKKLSWAETYKNVIEQLLKAEAWDELTSRYPEVYQCYLALFNFGQVDYCRRTCIRLIEAARNSAAKEIEARWLHDRAVTMEHLGNLDEAENCCRQALDLTGDKELEAHILNRLSVVMLDSGRIREAKSILEKSASIREYPMGNTWTDSQLAEILEYEGALLYALDVQARCTEEAKGINDLMGVQTYLLKKGRVLRKLGDSSECLRSLDIAEAIGRQLGWLKRLSSVLYEKANQLLLLQQYEEAEKALSESWELVQALGYPKQSAECAYSYGTLHLSLGNRAGAIEKLRYGLGLNTTTTNYKCAVKLGVTLLQENRAEEARDYTGKGIELCKGLLEDCPRLYDAAYFLGIGYLWLGHPAEALDTLRQAVNMCPARGVVEEYLMNLRFLEGSMYRVKGLSESRQLLEQRLPPERS